MSEPGPEIFDGQQSTLTRRQADRLWDRMSARYAEQASGQVTLFAHDVVVRANAAVTSLRIVDPATGEEHILARGDF